MPGDFILDDLNVFLVEREFGYSTILTPQPSGIPISFQSIFDDTQQVFDAATGQYLNSAPQIQCKTSDVLTARINDLVQVSGVAANWYVSNMLADGTGMSTLLLSKGKVSK